MYNRYKSFCLNCMKTNACSCSTNKYNISIYYKIRPPKYDASKKEWKEFFKKFTFNFLPNSTNKNFRFKWNKFIDIYNKYDININIFDLPYNEDIFKILVDTKNNRLKKLNSIFEIKDLYSINIEKLNKDELHLLLFFLINDYTEKDIINFLNNNINNFDIIIETIKKYEIIDEYFYYDIIVHNFNDINIFKILIDNIKNHSNYNILDLINNIEGKNYNKLIKDRYISSIVKKYLKEFIKNIKTKKDNIDHIYWKILIYSDKLLNKIEIYKILSNIDLKNLNNNENIILLKYCNKLLDKYKDDKFLFNILKIKKNILNNIDKQSIENKNIINI